MHECTQCLGSRYESNLDHMINAHHSMQAFAQCSVKSVLISSAYTSAHVLTNFNTLIKAHLSVPEKSLDIKLHLFIDLLQTFVLLLDTPGANGNVIYNRFNSRL